MSWVTWPLRLLGFALWFAGQIVLANTRLVADVLVKADRTTPLVIRHTTRCRGDAEAAVLAILVSLTPGTLVLASTGHGRERHTIYVHAMYTERSDVVAGLTLLEDRMLHALRRGGERT
ncbi:MAG: Na+/H+ antiporter subunit E [Dermatophilaceae bacterium]